MSTNTRQVLDAAQPFIKTNELVEYLVNMIKYHEQDLTTKIQIMRNRMDTLENVVDGHEGYHYQMRGDLCSLGTDIDIIQAQIFELTGTLVTVLNLQCGLALEW